jgi:hypothetical protein
LNCLAIKLLHLFWGYEPHNGLRLGVRGLKIFM